MSEPSPLPFAPVRGLLTAVGENGFVILSLDAIQSVSWVSEQGLSVIIEGRSYGFPNIKQDAAHDFARAWLEHRQRAEDVRTRDEAHLVENRAYASMDRRFRYAVVGSAIGIGVVLGLMLAALLGVLLGASL